MAGDAILKPPGNRSVTLIFERDTDCVLIIRIRRSERPPDGIEIGLNDLSIPMVAAVFKLALKSDALVAF